MSGSSTHDLEKLSYLIEIDIHPLQFLVVGASVPENQLGEVRHVIAHVTHTPDASRPCSPEIICLKNVNMRSIKNTLPVKHVKRMDQYWTYQKAVPTWLPYKKSAMTQLSSIKYCKWFTYTLASLEVHLEGVSIVMLITLEMERRGRSGEKKSSVTAPNKLTISRIVKKDEVS